MSLHDGDLELIQRRINEAVESIVRRLEPLEALLGLAEPWQTAANTLESLESRLTTLETRVVDAAPEVEEAVRSEAEALSEALDDVREAVEAAEDAAENAEIAAETAAEAALEAVIAAEESDSDPVPDEPSETDEPEVEEQPGIVAEIINDTDDGQPVPQRGNWFTRPLFSR